MAKPTTPAIQLDHLPTREVNAQIGELVGVSLRRSGCSVILRRRTGELTILNPAVLDSVSDEDMAVALLEAWSEEEIEHFLLDRAARLSR